MRRRIQLPSLIVDFNTLYARRLIAAIGMTVILALTLNLFTSLAASESQPQAAGPSVVQWTPYVITLTASQNLEWSTFPVQVTFKHSGGAQLTLDGYWDDDKTWRVRFAPPLAGSWTWTSVSGDSGLNGQSGSLTAIVPSEAQKNTNRNLKGHLQISDDGRYFVYADGTPFFWLADTNWHMNTIRAGLGNNQNGPFYTWLNDRLDKGFTVIMGRYFSNGNRNEGGYPFLLKDSPSFKSINPAFFQSLDPRVQSIWDEGLVLAGHPDWISEVMPLADAIPISRYLMSRYGAYNLVWSLSGEYQLSYESNVPYVWTKANWNALGNAVQSVNPYDHPVSVHPRGYDDGVNQQTSAVEFHNQSWLDHNWIQSGQSPLKLYRVPGRVLEDRARTPAKPVVHSEGFYENWKANGASAYQIRWQAWSALVSGAAGHTYGHGAVWAFYDPNDAKGETGTKSWDSTPWWEGLESTGSAQMSHVRTFFDGVSWWNLEPHSNWLQVNGSAPALASSEDITPPQMAAWQGHEVVVYVPLGNGSKSLEILQLDGKSYVARWYNPRNGNVTAINGGEPVNTDGDDRWMAPATPSNEDWVLHLTVSSSSGTTPTFSDVPATHPYYAEVEALYASGYTAGCGEAPLRYCPEQTMNRAESAVFVVRGVHGAQADPDDPSQSPFADLAAGDWALNWAYQLYQDGYTAGCGEDPLLYCPWSGHTRAEAAVFYLRMMNGAGYEPPAPAGQFSDVAAGAWYAKWVEAAYNAGILPACGQNPLKACPEAPLDRGLAAYMLYQAKGLTP